MGSQRWAACFSMVLGMLALAMVLGLMGAMGGGLRVAQAQPVDEAPPARHVAATDVTTRYVSSVTGDDGNGDCTDDTAPCATIQYAVDQADDGDVVLIAALDNETKAVYTGGEGEEIQENVVEVTKSLTLHGGYAYAHLDAPPVNTWTPLGPLSTVDGENQRRAIHISGDVTVTLRMLAFVNGRAANQGGNVYAEDALVRFIATPVLSGSAQYGGGLYLKNCRTAFDPGGLSDGEFDFGFDLGFGLDDDLLDQLGVSGLLLVRDNEASQGGGGIYVEGGEPAMAGLAVVSNTATVDGGGLYLKGGRPVFAGGLVLSNQAANRGGGFFLGDSAARIAGTAVYSNTAANGAGLYLDGPIAFSESTVPIIANNYVRYNHTTASRGGGFYFHKAIAGLVNNVVADNVSNEGAGMYLYASSPQVFHTTLAQNTGGGQGIYVTHQPEQVLPPAPPIPSLPSFTNTIIVSHSVGLYVETTGFPAPLENKVTLQGTLWHGNDTRIGGPGAVVQSTDVYSAPRFICTGDLPQCVLPYHVMTDSAAVDAGVDVALSIPGTDLFVDIDGQMRPANQAYDIGADEVVTRAFDLWFMPPAAYQTIKPGKTVTYTHWLMNTGLQTDTYDLDFLSSEAWADLLGERTITLTPRTSETVRVRVTAPETATAQLQEISIVTATSRSNSERWGRVIDVTGVFTGERTDVQVNKWAEVDEIKSGEVVNFTVVITNAGPLTGTLAVTLTDRVAPPEAVTGLTASDDYDCASDPDEGSVTCTLTLTGTTLPVTRVVNIEVSTSENYTGVLYNTAVVHSAARDENSQNNQDDAAVSIGAKPICIPIDNVTIQGDRRVLSGTLAAFEARISPSDATTPTFYAWEPDYIGSVVVPGHSIVTYTWHTTGTKTITVTATNCGEDGWATDDKEVIVHVEGEGGEKRIYLPLVLRNG